MLGTGPLLGQTFKMLGTGGAGGRGWSLAIGDGWWCLVLVVGVGAIDCLKDCLDEKINPKCTVSVYSDNMFTGNGS